mgnify:CR=1 FL=1|tara:strand:- start:495 stop:773 length:279 start_codon:yes stop_codon:yes gene_type:complete
MTKILLLLFLSSTLINAGELSSEFYEPNISNAYQGRLIYNPLSQDYPIDEMRRLCERYTGVDTAQIKCEIQRSHQKMVACKYKCSMHWSIID